MMKKLTFLTVKRHDSKENSQFISQEEVLSLNKNGKKLNRILFLFSDCIFVMSLPGFIINTCKVQEELSLNNIMITRVDENESKGIKFKWGLNFDAQEGNYNFYFINEVTMKKWENLLKDVIKNYSETNTPQKNLELEIGKIAPQWQKDGATEYCNGLGCFRKFTPIIRRHHCRADGLLYCHSCCPFKIQLKFLKSSESKICELCYQILHQDFQSTLNPDEAQKKLKIVFDLKTRNGRKKGWLEERVYNSIKKSFSLPVKYLCELDVDHPYIHLYEKYEDKLKHHGIMLIGMNIMHKTNSKYYGKLNPCQFTIEHQDTTEVYLFKAASVECCEKWIECIIESVNSYMNTV